MLDFVFLAIGVSIPALVILLSYVVENRRWRGILAEQRRLHDLRAVAESRYIAGNRLATMIAAMSLSMSVSTMHPDGLCPEDDADEQTIQEPAPAILASKAHRLIIGADIPSECLIDDLTASKPENSSIIIVQTRFGARARDLRTGRFVKMPA